MVAEFEYPAGKVCHIGFGFEWTLSNVAESLENMERSGFPIKRFVCQGVGGAVKSDARGIFKK